MNEDKNQKIKNDRNKWKRAEKLKMNDRRQWAENEDLGGPRGTGPPAKGNNPTVSC
jgi:hypothetical protein